MTNNIGPDDIYYDDDQDCFVDMETGETYMDEEGTELTYSTD